MNLSIFSDFAELLPLLRKDGRDYRVKNFDQLIEKFGSDFTCRVPDVRYGDAGYLVRETLRLRYQKGRSVSSFTQEGFCESISGGYSLKVSFVKRKANQKQFQQLYRSPQ